MICDIWTFLLWIYIYIYIYIYIGNIEYLISQYADDTVLILDGLEKSLNAALYELHLFFRFSGLKINLSKTQAVWIGNRADVWKYIHEMDF